MEKGGTALMALKMCKKKNVNYNELNFVLPLSSKLYVN